MRGIPNTGHQFIDDKGNVKGSVFKPHSKEKPIDGWFHESINWEDDTVVLEKTLSELNDDKSIKYAGGVARVSRISIDKLSENGILKGKIGYNREPDFPKKPFHGNILLHEDISTLDKQGRARMYGQLATTIVERIPQNP